MTDEHRVPPPPPFLGVVGRCTMCGDPVGKGRRFYCGEGCSDLRYYLFGNSRWRSWKFGLDTFGDATPRCFHCGLTAHEAVLQAGESFREAWRPLELDHIVPLWSLTDEERAQHRWWLPFNYQLLCHWCHAKKSRREAKERALAGRIEHNKETWRRVGMTEAEIENWEMLVRRNLG